MRFSNCFCFINSLPTQCFASSRAKEKISLAPFAINYKFNLISFRWWLQPPSLPFPPSHTQIIPKVIWPGNNFCVGKIFWLSHRSVLMPSCRHMRLTGEPACLNENSGSNHLWNFFFCTHMKQKNGRKGSLHHANCCLIWEKETFLLSRVVFLCFSNTQKRLTLCLRCNITRLPSLFAFHPFFRYQEKFHL